MIPAVDHRGALDRAYDLVDELVGVVRQLVVHDVAPSDPPFFYATAQLGSTRPFSDVEAARANAGAGWDPSSAVMGALGEAMERYAIGIYRETELVRGSYQELGPKAVDPRELVFFAEEQYRWDGFPYAPPSPTETLSWVPATSLVDGSERLVPAARVYTPYRAPRKAELIMQSTSTGAACHVDRDQAILRGLQECIERDAFMIAWLNGLALPTISPADLGDGEIDTALERLRRQGLAVTFFDATSDLPCPTVVCALRGGPRRIPALAFGAATRDALLPAARKALVESAHTWFWVHTRVLATGEPPLQQDFANVRTLNDHSLLYGHPRMRSRAEFLYGEIPEPVCAFRAQALALAPRECRPPRGALGRCVEVLGKAGLEPIVVDVTPDDIRACGFVVVRVVVAGLHPLWGGHQVRCLGGSRLRRVPVAMGYFERERTTEEFNRDPHPMP